MKQRAALCLLVWLTHSLTSEWLLASPPEDQQQLASILSQRCLACHGPTKQEGGYRVDTIAKLRKPGDSGALPVIPGNAKQSELFKRLTTDDVDARMPAGAPALPAPQIANIEKWIADGAKLEAGLETQSITSWSKRAIKARALEHYPSALPVTALAIASSADATSLWTSGYGEALRWNISDSDASLAQLAQRIPTEGKHISDIDLSADGKLMAISSGTPGAQGFVQLFAVRDESYQVVWTQSCPDVPADLAFAPDGQQLAIGQSDGTLLIATLVVDHPEQIATQVLAPHADAILALNWSAKGDRLITGSRDRTAKIFDTQQWQLIANYDRHERAVGGVAYLDRYPVSLDETGKLRLWSGDDSDRTVAERDNQARFLEPVLPHGKRIWFAMAGDLRSWEIERKTVDDGKDDAGKPKQKTTTRWIAGEELKSAGTAWLLSIAGNSKLIAAGNELGEVILWRDGQTQPWRRFLAKP